MSDADKIAQLIKARGDLRALEAELPPGVPPIEPLARLLNSIAAVRNRIRFLEACLLPIVEEPA